MIEVRIAAVVGAAAGAAPGDPAGVGVAALREVGGGYVARAFLGRLGDGRHVFAKVLPTAVAGLLAREAAGLRWLAAAEGGAPVPEVLGVADDVLVLRAVEPGRPDVAAAERFDGELAATHRAGAEVFGSREGAGWIGTLPLPAGPWPDWPTMWVQGRLLPYLRLARDRGAIGDGDLRGVEHVLGRVADLAGPPEPPARLHGDLWSGNVVWGADGRGWLVDPAAHGGHRESDLAMLALFGAPHLHRLLRAYDEAWPLAAGWDERVALHQLHPVLVHAALFAGGYGAQAGRLARSLA